MSKNIGKQVAKGTFWTVLMRTSIRLLGIVSVLITARVLVPEDFGIVAKAVLISSFLELITQFGFDAALIKDQKATRDDYDTVWTLSILRALLLSAGLVIASDQIAIYFNEPEIKPLIHCYAISIMLMGFTNVGIVDFRKKMNFNKDFKFNVFKKVTSFITTLTIAVYLRSYWAFPIGVLVGSIAGLLASFILSRYRPSITLNSWHNLFHFSKNVFGFEFINAFSRKLDGAILSKYADSQTLGFYTVAQEISNMPASEISMPIARASLPGLATLNEDTEKFRDLNSTILGFVLFIAIPAALGLSAVAEEITLIALGDKWLDASRFIEIMAFFSISDVISSVAISSFMAFDVSHVLIKLSIFRAVLRVCFLGLGFYYLGPIGLSWGMLATGVFVILFCVIKQIQLGMLSGKKLLSYFFPSLISSVVMFIAINQIEIELGFAILCLIKVLAGIFIFSILVLLIWLLFGKKEGPERVIYNYLVNKINT